MFLLSTTGLRVREEGGGERGEEEREGRRRGREERKGGRRGRKEREGGEEGRKEREKGEGEEEGENRQIEKWSEQM